MLEFKPLRICDTPLLRAFLRGDGQICDNTPGTAVMWREYFDTHFAICGDTAVLRMVRESGEVTYSMPCGDIVGDVTEEIVSDVRRRGVGTRFCSMSESRAALLSEKYGGVPNASRTWADYLYPARNFVSYSGKKLREKRNHMNRFLAERKKWEFVPMDKSSLPLAREFYLGYMERSVKDSVIARREAQICLDVLDRWDEYGFDGGVLIADGRVAGITAGEAIGDTLYVHIEKADRAVNGAYQMTASCFVRSFGDSIAFVNREDDSGDEGLRKSKLSYRPCELVYKYSLAVM